MLIELLVFLIEKGFAKNSEKIYTFMDMYDSIKNEVLRRGGSETKKNSGEEEKFSKEKFFLFLKEIGKKIYPGNPEGFEKFIYPRIMSSDDDQRLKIEEVVKKILTRETINKLR